MLGLYHNEGKGLFIDEAPRSTIGRASLLSLTFGAFFFDYDLDGYQDIFTANGHIEEEIERVQPKVRYRQAPQLFRNIDGKRFEDVTARMGSAFNRPVVARGAAHGDYDRDGDLDIVITTNDGPAYLFRNDGGNRNHWLQVKLTGTQSNRSAVGAAVRVVTASGRMWDMVRSGSSYCSQSDLTLTFGLGQDAKVVAFEVEWPSGQKQQFRDLAADRRIHITEGSQSVR
jgi:hypothetical protein